MATIDIAAVRRHRIAVQHQIAAIIDFTSKGHVLAPGESMVDRDAKLRTLTLASNVTLLQSLDLLLYLMIPEATWAEGEGALPDPNDGSQKTH